jgi:hypothetical protein
MITKVILCICFLGALGSLVIGFAGLGWSLMSAEEVLIFPLVVGPYAVIVVIAWWRRRSHKESMLLLTAVFVIAAYGLWSFGASSYRRHFDPHGGMAMDLSPLVVPALQWLVVTILAAVIGVASAVRSKDRKA